MKVSIPERVLEALKPYAKIAKQSRKSVSIPERVLEALKLNGRMIFDDCYHVSIPERVLEALKRFTDEEKTLWDAFQSLKGF